MARDLFRELGVNPADPAPGGRDLFKEFEIDAAPGITEKVKAAAGAVGDFLTGAVTQTGRDIGRLASPERSVMEGYGRDVFEEVGVAPPSAGADPRDVAVAGRVVERMAAENRRRKIGSLEPTDAVIDAPFRKPLAPVRPAGVLPRAAKDVAAGVTGLSAGFAGAGEWLTGSSNAGAAAKYLEAVTQNLLPEDPNFGDELAAGAGSFAAFFLPGLGVAKGAQAIAKVNTALANWLGAGSSAALEASAEAGAVYRDLRREGRSVEQASRAATAVFWSNAALVGVTNRMGLFADAGGAARRGTTSAVMEGFQEGSQQAISNIVTDRPVSEGVGTSAAIGAILGGGAGTVLGARSRPRVAEGTDLAARSAAIAEADDVAVSEPVTRPETAPQPRLPASEGTPVAAEPSNARQAQPEPQSGAGMVSGQPERAAAQAGAVDTAAHEAATSPQNALPEPTDAQKDAGNFQKGHARIAGLDVSIEHPAGSERSGTGADGQPWSVTMPAHYGYIRRTEGKDGEQVDVYVKPGTPEDWSGTAFVIDQVDPATGRFDEHKAVVGARDQAEAQTIYDGGFSDGSGPRRRGAVTALPLAEFKTWLREGDTKAPLAVDGQRAPGGIVPKAWPKDIPAKVYRGTGRASKEAAYGGVAVPIAGEGRYFTFSREAAKRYGSSIEQAQAPVSNPLVIRSGEEWRALTRQAGWEFPNPFGMPEKKTRGLTQRLQEVVRSQGHDGLIVHWNDSLPYDVDPKTGGNIKLLRDVFGEPQVIAYGAAPAADTASRSAPPAAEEVTPAARTGDDRTPESGGIDFARIRAGQPLINARDGYGISATGLPEGQYLISPAGSKVSKDRASWPFQPFVADENGVRAFASRSRPAADAAAAPRAALGSPPIDEPGADLAATAVPRRAYAPPAEAVEKVDTDQARPDQIREAIQQLFNVPINERGVTVRRAVGIYKVKPQTIRVRNRNDIDVIAHEVGHHFSETNKRVRGLMQQHEGELLAITPDAYAGEPKALRREEGFAEFVRLYLTQPAEARRRAPQFLKGFDTFVGANPHYRAAFDQVRGMVDQWFNLDPVERIMAKVGARPQSIAERLRETFGKDRLIFEVFDNWLPLKRMVADLNPGIAASRDPFKAAHLLSGDAAIIEDWLVSGTVPYDPVKRANPANYGKPLHDILKPVAKELREFSAYLIARRAQELQARGKERLFTDEEIRAGLTLETPAFKAAADEVYAYNDRLLEYAVEGELLSEEAAAQFREYTAYIPFFREFEDSASGRGKGGVLQRLRGGTGNVRDPISNIIQNTANIIHATNRNAVLIKARALARSVPGGGRWIEDVPIPQKALQVSTERILKELQAQGVAIDTALAEDLATMQTFFQRDLSGDRGNRIIIAKVNGEPKALQINNKLLWRALQAFEPLDLGLVGSMLAVPSDLLRAGVTLSPEFMARNFMRDTLSGFIQSKPGMVPLIGTVGGFKEVATRSDTYKLYHAFGGAYADLWKGESEQTRKVLERMARRGKFDPRTILTPSGLIEVLRRIGSVSEAGTRVAEFKKTAKAGGIDALFDAAYNAREVSVDFGMHGHNQTVRFLTRITPFMNPALQGFYKMARTGRDQFFMTMLRGSMLAAFSVALYLLNRDGEWYDEIEQWEKNLYWHFDVGLRTDEGKVIPLRLPKPFEWGGVFGSIPESIAEAAIAASKEGARFTRDLWSIFEDTFGLRMIPTAALVPAEQWANVNVFTDRPIVPEAKEKLDPELQYGPGTSLTAREVGRVTGTSPARIDHMVRGLLGTMGVYSVMLADQALRGAGDYPEPPAMSWRQMPVVKAFVRDPDNPNSRYVNEFYELLGKVRRAEASHRKYEGEAADAYYKKHEATMSISQAAGQAARQMADLRKDSEDIAARRDYTSQEKRRIINENNAMIKEIAKGIMEAVQ